MERSFPEARSFAGKRSAAEPESSDSAAAEMKELLELLRAFSRLDAVDRATVLELALTMVETPDVS